VYYTFEGDAIKMVKINLSEADFFKLYNPQTGGSFGTDGTSFYKRQVVGRQRGHGIGGIFGAIARKLIPFVGNLVWPHAKSALKNIAVDVLDGGRPWQESLKENSLNALKGIGSQVFAQSGKGRRRKRKVQSGGGAKSKLSIKRKQIGGGKKEKKKQAGKGVKKRCAVPKKKAVKQVGSGGKRRKRTNRKPTKRQKTRRRANKKQIRSIFD
jgi:hypothetical protein